MADKKTINKFSKEQILNAKNPIGDLDVLFVVLEDGKLYTKDEVKKLENEFLERRVK